ncbi:MAG: acylphosphatase [Candidatus Hadarchaeota archaeon]|nr:acylphosphatase [Candidatus Hadarchaeota archaeon]
MKMKVRAHVHVSGRVQGVFFRYETKEIADRLGIEGWVRNTQDGRVEAVFEGEKEKIEEMLNFCHRGPPGASVSDVKVERQEPKGEFTGFGIRYGW